MVAQQIGEILHEMDSRVKPENDKAIILLEPMAKNTAPAIAASDH